VTPASLADWLAHCERLHPSTPEPTLARAAQVRDRLGLRFDATVITVAGTNGKGSSCAMLESIARCAGWRTGLYTSPHLVHFEERCRIGGQVVDAAQLLPHFAAVEAARGDVALTYFEFTTLAILHRLAAQPLDVVILEVGLGGRLDAVNAIDADCALLTSIDLDHVAILGPDREAIGREKAHVMRAGRPAVIADPLPPASVRMYGEALGADLWLAGRDFAHGGDRQQWSWHGRQRRLPGLAYPALRGANQLLNAGGVLAVFEALQARLPVSAQAVRQGLATVDLPGRFQTVPGHPALVFDVAHNPQAAAVLARNLEQMGFYPCTHAVFGAMRDKDIGGMLDHLDALVDRWYLCDLPLPRAARAAEIEALMRTRHAGAPAAASCHAAPADALRAALGAADPADRIVVFGSFLCVGGVLQHGTAHWRAPSGV
jgi:dihydrofolate synthase/folylpolyglutamate synthase